MIRAEHIFKNFDDQVVLNDVSCSFEQGKANLIIGRSGAGKTVLLKILIGLIKPSSGQVFYDNIDFYSLNKKQTRECACKSACCFKDLHCLIP